MTFAEIFGSPNGFLTVSLLAVCIAIAVFGLVSAVVSVWLMISYAKYNRRPNSAGLTGEETARRILDANGLANINVSTTGSFVFGNSYSRHYGKVRLRRFTRGEKSITAMAMGSEKAALAVLDKEGDPEMQRRVKIYPIITFGPFAFIPLILVGALLDVWLFHAEGYLTAVLSALGMLFYLFAIVLAFLTLHTEKKAQDRACELLREQGLATEEEIGDMKSLFRLYNVQYINDIILSMLEVLYRVLRIAVLLTGKGGSSKKSHSR